MALTTMGVLTATAVAAAAAAAEGAHDPHPALAMQPVPAGVGVNIHFYDGNDDDWAMIEAAGVGIVRMDVSWGGSEKEPGQYDFTHYDALIARLEQRGIRLLFIIDYGNPLYDDGLAPHSDECRDAYARFCAALAKRYRDKHVIWELWNEPNISFWKPKPNVDDYMAWCHAVVPAIRQADPGACVIAPATSCIPLSFLEDCFERGLLKLVDGVSVHPYRSASQGPETAVPEYRALRSLIERYRAEGGIRRTIPILSGEWGYTTAEMTPEQHGKYLARQWLTNMAHGLPISIWYDWHDDGQDPNEREHHFGTVTWDYQPKPTYTAMKTLIAELRGFMPMGRLPTEDGKDFLVAFRRANDAFKLALWTTGDGHHIALDPSLRVAGAVDHLGQAVDVSHGTRQPVADAPRYLTLGPPFPTWLQMMPLRAEVAAHPAGDRDETAVSLDLRNPTDKPVRIRLEPVTAAGVSGHWESGADIALAPGEQARAWWRGAVHRRDLPGVSASVGARIEAEGESPYPFAKTVELPVLDAVSIRVAWRHDGAYLLSGDSLKATATATLDGTPLPPVDLGRQAGPSPCARRLAQVDLAAGPRRLGVRVLDEAGHLVAEVAEMTYALVDAFDDAPSDELAAHYRLWHEGEDKRTADINGAIVSAPGQDPPFPKAARIDYALAPGWVFWQLGPQGQPQMAHAKPKRIQLWIHGDGSGDRMRCRVVDATGQTFQPDAGDIDFTGWRRVEFALEGPMGRWGGTDDGVIHPPLRWISYFLQDPCKAASEGTTCVTGVVVTW